MSKITDYKTLSASWPDELDEKVNEAIREGWELHGEQYFETAFHQPVIKRDPSVRYMVEMSPPELAGILNVYTDDLNENAKNGYGIKGVPVDDWLVKDASGDPEYYMIPKPEYDKILKAYKPTVRKIEP